MSNRTKTCPVCGEIVDAEEMFCPSCGEDLSGVGAEQAEAVSTDYVDRSVSTGSGRNNIMGDNIVNAQDQSTTNNIDNSQTTNTSTVHNVQNTSNSVTNQQTVGSIDNSQQVVNNITIIGGGGGMTLPGGITLPEDAKSQGAPALKGDFHHGMKGYDGGHSAAPAPKGGGYAFPPGGSAGSSMGLGKILGYAAAVAVIVIAFVAVRGGGDKAPEAPQEEVQEEVEQVEVAPVQQAAPRRVVSRVETVQEAAPVEKTAPQQAASVSDANYEAGMRAYNSGDGLEAVRNFQSSGSAEANYMLGVIYETGCGGVEANAMKARSFYKKAAALGSAQAKARL